MPPPKSRKRIALRASKFASESKKIKCDNSNIQNPISDNRDHIVLSEPPSVSDTSALVFASGNPREPILPPRAGGVRGNQRGNKNIIKICRKLTTTMTQVTKKKVKMKNEKKVLVLVWIVLI